MLKMLINEEEVVSNKDFTIKKEMLNTPSVILNNVYPKTWEEDKDYTSRFYHPNDYSKCKIVDETYIPPEEGTTVTSNTGEIYITDADNTKENDYKVQGKAEQHSYSGKNLQKNELTTGSGSGLTWTVNEDKSVTINGTNTSGATRFIRIAPDFTLPPGTYTLSNGNANVNNNTFIFYDDKGHFPRTNISTITTQVDDVISPYIRITAGTTVNNETIYPMIEVGSQATSYEPFTNNLPTPNPYYPEEIKTVSGIENLVDTSGNPDFLYGNTQYEKNGATVIVKNNTNDITKTYAFVEYYIDNLKPNTTYTISFDATIGNNGYISCEIMKARDGSVGSNQLLRINGSSSGHFTGQFTTPADTSTMSMNLYSLRGTYYENVSVTYSNLQIEEGTTPHTPVPYGHWLPVKVSNKNLFDINTLVGMSNVTVSGNKLILAGSTDYHATPSGVNLKDIANLEVGKTYTLSFNTTYNAWNANKIYLRGSASYWTNGTSLTITQTMLDDRIAFYGTNDSEISNIQIEEGTEVTDYIEHQEQTTLIDLNKYDENNNIVGNYELCSIRDIKDLLTIKDGKAIINKDIEKLTFNGTETIQNSGGYNGLFQIKNIMTYPYKSILGMSNYFTNSLNMNITDNSSANNYLKDGQFAFRWNFSDSNRDRIYFKYLEMGTDVDAFKTWLSTHNTEVYYQLPATETITLRGTYDINLYEGVNHISIVDDDLIPVTTLHYNYVNEQTITDLLFCGVVKNSGNISLNPRYPHYSTLQILDFKNFLSEGELDAFVISNKTILEAIQMVIDSISSYGFVLGNINILNPNEIIGAYSTKDKSAYDVFSYIADITQSRWTTRVIDENTVAIDFYDPSLMEQGTTIEYTQEFFKNNLIDDMDYSYGTNDYRNKQIMTSNQVYSNISQSQSIVANGYQTQFQTEQPLGQIISITSDGKELTFATNNAKELGFTADFYYTPGNNYFESADLRATGEVLNIEYMAIVEGRQIITNPNEIQRVADSTNRKGIVTRYENRNDAITSNELQLIGQSYIKYKGTPEIVLKIKSRSNIWEVGQRVQFNAPIDELNTEYMVRSKEINHIATTDTIFYTYELTSSFNSETAINYFDNQRAKAKGNIGEGEYISRNVDVESTANIIFYDTQATEVTITGDNSLNSVLNAPFIN